MNPISIRLPAELDARLTRLAAQTGRTKTFFMLEAIKRHVEDLEDQQLAEQRLQDVRDGISKTHPLDEVLDQIL